MTIQDRILKMVGLKSPKNHGLLEEVFESALYNCRFLVLFAVLGSVVASINVLERVYRGCSRLQ